MMDCRSAVSSNPQILKLMIHKLLLIIQQKSGIEKKRLRKELRKAGAVMDFMGGPGMMGEAGQNESDMEHFQRIISHSPAGDTAILACAFGAALDTLRNKALPGRVIGRFKLLARLLEAQNRRYGKRHARALIRLMQPALT